MIRPYCHILRFSICCSLHKTNIVCLYHLTRPQRLLSTYFVTLIAIATLHSPYFFHTTSYDIRLILTIKLLSSTIIASCHRPLPLRVHRVVDRVIPKQVQGDGQHGVRDSCLRHPSLVACVLFGPQPAYILTVTERPLKTGNPASAPLVTVSAFESHERILHNA